jgi:PAS domain S-box-containing protein
MSELQGHRRNPTSADKTVRQPKALPAVRTMLILLVLAFLLPAAIGIGALATYLYRDGRADLQQETLRLTQALTLKIDNLLLGAEMSVEMLATAPSTAERDWAAVHARASELLKKRNFEENIIVSTASGQQIVDTRNRFGVALPLFGDLEHIAHVVATGKPLVSGLFASALSGRHVVVVSVPVFGNGKVTHVLSVGIPAQQLSQVLLNEHLPAPWIATIVDGSGTIVARTHQPEQFVGRQASKQFIEHARAHAGDGVLESTTIEGIPALKFYSRFASTGWNMMVLIPRTSLEAQLMRTIAFFSLAIAGLFGIGIALALLAGNRIARSVQALTACADTMGTGQLPPVSTVHFREADDVAQAMRRSAGLLRQQTQSLQTSLAALKASEESYQVLVEGSPDAVVLHQNGKILYVNPAFVKFAGDRSARDWIDKSVLDSIDPAFHATVLERMALLAGTAANATSPILQITCVKRDGKPFQAEIQNVQVNYQGRDAVHTTLRDISARILVEEERNRLFALSQDMLCTLGFDGTIKDVNPAWTVTLGYSRAQLLQMSYLDLVHPDDQQATLAAATAAASGNGLVLFENRYRCQDGSYRWLQWSTTPSLASESLYCVARDITERKRAEEERLAEALFQRQLLEQLPIGVALRNVQGNFVDVNPAFADILGLPREQILGMANAQVTAVEYKKQDAEQVRILYQSGRYGPYEKEYMRIDGRRVPVLSRGRLVKRNGETLILSVAEDISEKRKAEFQLAQTQKMDAIGQLTSGLAHDFNNMLGVVIGNLDLLADDVASDSAAKARVDTALMAAWRGADLTRTLLSVARAQAVTTEATDLTARLNELLPLLRHTAGPNIDLSIECGTSAIVVQVDSGGMASTLLNLVINARDAMPDGGRLTLSTQLHDVAPGAGMGTLAPGRYVTLSVTDSGSGMSAEVMANAMLPFFTTKERGRGTGLGLAMAHGFVKQCGGELLLHSEAGRGTTVQLILPLAEAVAADA